MFSFFKAPLCLREAVLSQLRRPFRSLLVLQAIVWGSAAAIFPQALYQGSMEMALTGTNEFANDRIVVTSPGGAVFDNWKQVAKFARNLPGIKFLTGFSRFRSGSRNFIGIDRDHLSARRLILASGRMFTRKEINQGAALCILEAKAAQTLFPGEDPIGKTVPFKKGRTLRVIGVLNPLSQSILNTDVFGFQKDHSFRFISRFLLSQLGVTTPGLNWLASEKNILVPWKTLGQKPGWILMRSDPQKIPGLLKRIERYFAESGRDVLTYSNTLLSVLFAPEFKDFLNLSGDIFLLCIIMGMIVIANVMLISINDRKLEIAVRRCEGAKTSDIISQFVLETGIFCLVGALIGIPLGVVLAWARSSLDPSALLSWALPWKDIALVLIYSFAGGLVAGVLPAWRASCLDPVEVLSRG